MFQAYTCECGPGAPPPIYDAGHEVCPGCGVVRGPVFEEAAEWFGADRARADFPPAAPQPESRGTRQVLATLAGAVAALRMQPNHVVDLRAREILLRIADERGVRAANRPGVAVGCLYAAFALENEPREMQALAARCGVTWKAAEEGYRMACDTLRGTPDFAALQARRLAPRDLIFGFAAALGLDNSRRKALLAAALRLDAALDAHTSAMSRYPRTICAALLFLAAKETATEITPAALHSACNVCPQVLHATAKELKAWLQPAVAVA